MGGGSWRIRSICLDPRWKDLSQGEGGGRVCGAVCFLQLVLGCVQRKLVIGKPADSNVPPGCFISGSFGPFPPVILWPARLQISYYFRGCLLLLLTERSLQGICSFWNSKGTTCSRVILSSELRMWPRVQQLWTPVQASGEEAWTKFPVFNNGLQGDKHQTEPPSSILQSPEVCERISCSVVSNSLRSHGLYPTRLLCPWNSPGRNTGVGSHSLFQGIFLPQGSNLGLPNYRQILHYLSH